MRVKRLISSILVICMFFSILSVTGYADSKAVALKDTQFTDIPDDWSTKALQNAVQNGLLKGSNGKIMPKDNLSRAQMAAVIARAFGATVKADLSAFTDIKSGAWYYEDMAKAYQMGVIQGSGSKLNPDMPISRQEVFAIVARALKLDPAAGTDKSFVDAKDIAGWAKGEVFALVNAGYVSGSNGKLNPKANITRAEFAKIFDNVVKNYVTSDALAAAEGNVMINVPGVTLKNLTVKGDLLIGEGVGNGDVTLDGVKVTGRMVVRGGGTNSIHVLNQSEMNLIILARNDGPVALKVSEQAKVSRVIVQSNGALVTAPASQVEVLAAVQGAVVNNKAVAGGVTIKPETGGTASIPVNNTPSTGSGNPGGSNGNTNNPPTQPTNVAVTGINLSHDSLTLTANATNIISAAVEPSNATNKAFSWSTDDAAVATVSNGVITAVGNGVTDIIVTTADGQKTDVCTVRVAPPGDNFVIKTSGTYINTAFNNVTISESVGNGEVTFQDVVINGTLTIRGGGAHSINLEGTTTVVGETVIEKVGGEAPRIALSGDSSLGAVTSETAGASIEAVGGSLGNVGAVSANAPISITGANVSSITAAANLTLTDASINNIQVPGSVSAQGVSIAMAGSTGVGSITADGSTTLSASGSSTNVGTVAANATTSINGTANVEGLTVLGSTSVTTQQNTSVSNITVGGATPASLTLAGQVNTVQSTNTSANITVSGSSAPAITGTVNNINVAGSASPVVSAAANTITVAASPSAPPSVTITGSVTSVQTQGTGLIGSINIGGTSSPAVNLAPGTTTSSVTIADSATPTVTAAGTVNNVITSSTGIATVNAAGTGSVGSVAATDTNKIQTTASEVRSVVVTLESIEVSSYPKKLVYGTGDTLDIDGLVVTGSYKVTDFDGRVTKVETITPADITGFNSTTAGTKVLTITKEGKTAMYPITVVGKAINLISVKTLPAKVIYEKGEAINLNGGKLLLTHTNAALYPNEEKSMTDSGVAASGFDSNILGNQPIIVTYESKTVTFMVTVKDTAAENLAKAKADAEAEINTVAAGKKQSDYSSTAWTQITAEKAIGILAVRDAVSIEVVTNAKQAAITKINAVKSVAEQNQADAADFIAAHSAVLSKTTETVTIGDKTAVNAALSEYALLSTGAKSALTSQKTLLDSLFAKITQLEAAQSAAEAKISAKSAVNSAYASYSTGYASNLPAITAAKNAGIASIDAATTVLQIITAKDQAIAAMAAFKSDAQLAEEALKAAKTDAVNALNNELNKYPQASYMTNWSLLINAKNTGIASINAAADIAAVGTAKAAAITAMSMVKSDAVLAAEALTVAKTKAKAELNSYKNLNDYRSAEQQQITAIRATGCTNIDAAASTAAVNSALSAAKAAIAAIKTNAQLTAEELASAKAQAVNQLNSYKSSSDYSAANWAIIIEKIQRGTSLIHACQTTAEVDGILSQIKADIDTVLTTQQENAPQIDNSTSITPTYNGYVYENKIFTQNLTIHAPAAPQKNLIFVNCVFNGQLTVESGIRYKIVMDQSTVKKPIKVTQSNKIYDYTLVELILKSTTKFDDNGTLKDMIPVITDYNANVFMQRGVGGFTLNGLKVEGTNTSVFETWQCTAEHTTSDGSCNCTSHDGHSDFKKLDLWGNITKATLSDKVSGVTSHPYGFAAITAYNDMIFDMDLSTAQTNMELLGMPWYDYDENGKPIYVHDTGMITVTGTVPGELKVVGNGQFNISSANANKLLVDSYEKDFIIVESGAKPVTVLTYGGNDMPAKITASKGAVITVNQGCQASINGVKIDAFNDLHNDIYRADVIANIGEDGIVSVNTVDRTSMRMLSKSKTFLFNGKPVSGDSTAGEFYGVAVGWLCFIEDGHQEENCQGYEFKRFDAFGKMNAVAPEDDYKGFSTYNLKGTLDIGSVHADENQCIWIWGDGIDRERIGMPKAKILGNVNGDLYVCGNLDVAEVNIENGSVHLNTWDNSDISIGAKTIYINGDANDRLVKIHAISGAIIYLEGSIAVKINGIDFSSADAGYTGYITVTGAGNIPAYSMEESTATEINAGDEENTVYKRINFVKDITINTAADDKRIIFENCVFSGDITIQSGARNQVVFDKVTFKKQVKTEGQAADKFNNRDTNVVLLNSTRMLTSEGTAAEQITIIVGDNSNVNIYCDNGTILLNGVKVAGKNMSIAEHWQCTAPHSTTDGSCDCVGAHDAHNDFKKLDLYGAMDNVTAAGTVNYGFLAITAQKEMALNLQKVTGNLQVLGMPEWEEYDENGNFVQKHDTDKITVTGEISGNLELRESGWFDVSSVSVGEGKEILVENYQQKAMVVDVGGKAIRVCTWGENNLATIVNAAQGAAITINNKAHAVVNEVYVSAFENFYGDIHGDDLTVRVGTDGLVSVNTGDTKANLTMSSVANSKSFKLNGITVTGAAELNGKDFGVALVQRCFRDGGHIAEGDCDGYELAVFNVFGNIEGEVVIPAGSIYKGFGTSRFVGTLNIGNVTADENQSICIWGEGCMEGLEDTVKANIVGTINGSALISGNLDVSALIKGAEGSILINSRDYSDINIGNHAVEVFAGDSSKTKILTAVTGAVIKLMNKDASATIKTTSSEETITNNYDDGSILVITIGESGTIQQEQQQP